MTQVTADGAAEAQSCLPSLGEPCGDCHRCEGASAVMPRLRTPLVGGCWDCGRSWEAPGWVDAWIPDDLWLRIAPLPDGRGHLCIHCITAALDAIGARNVSVTLWAAPYETGENVA